MSLSLGESEGMDDESGLGVFLCGSRLGDGTSSASDVVFKLS